MKNSYEQRIQNQFGAFCVKVLKNEDRYIQREYARLRDQEKSLGELTASELEQTAVWGKHFMDEHVFDVQGLPVVVTGDLLADALAQLPEGKRCNTLTVTALFARPRETLVIDIAKLKTHGMMGYSGAVKNLFGVVPGRMR